jgi:DNA-binding PadR family transcriptional regulator
VILVAPADQERHGYAIMQDVGERTGGEVRLSAGTLYSAVRRMLEQGLIEEPARERRVTDLLSPARAAGRATCGG